MNQEVEQLLSTLTRGEKAELLRRVVQDLDGSYPGIDSRPDIAGGEARIVRTRIPVWVLEQARRLGTTEAEILTSFPTIIAQDLANAWAYAHAHRGEIEQAIRENEEA